MRLVWSAFALSDRDNIFTHIERENPAAAIAVDERIAVAARRLRAVPESGRTGRVAGTRELVVTGTAYLVSGETVRILRVLHGAQQWPEELSSG